SRSARGGNPAASSWYYRFRYAGALFEIANAAKPLHRVVGKEVACRAITLSVLLVIPSEVEEFLAFSFGERDYTSICFSGGTRPPTQALKGRPAEAPHPDFPKPPHHSSARSPPFRG